ncbi:ribosomal protein S18-alanine N-acetyltransferase [Actinoalloteichus hymeniacidonis]|uniref:Ribosomal-protein-alanine acetyltransferase n=1 Tax=Actinoalloteichus hymeniacidonis TaxID=340345 RepID=A0AAC9MZS2_9PSEU|nr:ribosomal protein S18-alanine N-acetyltransferase [Actinoalloteichus hymeniacidonis]AOS65743.1 ribosomal-protein-alanine acetyltransferase [Actinoalloteichus hymeniacidonis]MBB5906167.1 ribosomal-protein-alanine N-acetyltransferase [Actinoalloteichus hymeniacidonis]
MSFRLLPLTEADLARCAELEAQLFPGDDPWRESAFRAELAAGHLYLAAHRVDAGSAAAGDDAKPAAGAGTLIGYAGLAVVGRAPDFEAEVHTIAVDPEYQGRGVGTALLGALLDRADQVRAATFLEVRTDNRPAIAMYERNGFEVVGLRKRYYQPSGADAHTMRRPARRETQAGTNEETA